MRLHALFTHFKGNMPRECWMLTGVVLWQGDGPAAHAESAAGGADGRAGTMQEQAAHACSDTAKQQSERAALEQACKGHIWKLDVYGPL